MIRPTGQRRIGEGDGCCFRSIYKKQKKLNGEGTFGGNGGSNLFGLGIESILTCKRFLRETTFERILL